MTRRFFSGTSIEQAVLLAARHYGLEPDEVAYTERKKRHGFLRVRRSVIVEVDPENPRREAGAEIGAEAATSPPPSIPRGERRMTNAGARSEKPVREKPARTEPVREEAVREEPEGAEPTPPAEEFAVPASPEAAGPWPEIDLVDLPQGPIPATEKFPVAEGAVALAAEKSVRLTLELLGAEAEIDVRQGEGQLEIELISDDKDRLLDDDGRVLGAIQHLVPRLTRGFIGEGVACRVDCDQFLQIHEERLRDLAQRSADEAKRRDRPWVLKPMSPEERRVVHLALADDSAVRTQSIGDGFFKRVRISPV
jgi:spoIIIJ-associated protein